MGPITINASGLYSEAKTHTDVIRALAVDNARAAVKGTTPLTNSSGGSGSKVTRVAPVFAQPNSGTNLAGKASSETALGTVKDAIGELYAQANALATKLGLPNVTNNGGGTTPNGTVDAITVSVTAAATGCSASETNAIFAAFNGAFYNLAALTSRLTAATGAPKLTMSNWGDTGKVKSTIAALSTDTGTAASPGVTKAAMDAALSKFRDNANAIAVALNAVVAAKTPGVLATSV